MASAQSFSATPVPASADASLRQAVVAAAPLRTPLPSAAA